MKQRMRPAAIWLILGLLLTAAALAGCSSSHDDLVKDKINVITSFYPLYDFASKIGGDRVHVINLVPAGVEPHEWTPKSGDIQRVLQAQLFVYQGAGLEGWVEPFFKSMPKDSKTIIVEAGKGVSLLKTADARSGEGIDPHLWLSPLNARIMAENIKNGLVRADPAHQSEYEANYANLEQRFAALDNKYREELSRVPQKNIVVSHRAFGYLCREYGLTQLAIMGLSPDAEPTAQTMKTIVDFVEKNHVKTIFFEELVSDKLAKTLAADAGVGTMTLNPLEGLTKAETAAGDDYFSVMETNLAHLVAALQ